MVLHDPAGQKQQALSVDMLQWLRQFDAASV
jgi:hypothetical protein